MRDGRAALACLLAFHLTLGFGGIFSASADSLERKVREAARLCVAESGWHDHATCAAQVHVIARRAKMRGETFVHHVRAYSTAWGSGRRPWVMHLRDSANPPRHWPDGASWRRYRPHFAALKLVAQRALTGGPDPCFGEAWHFAACSIDRTDLGWQRISCPGTARQCFWSDR